MELEAASRRAQLVRMEDQDRVSQASSVATISYFPVRKESDGKVHTFGKRCQAAKRDPNCPVVIRGWLNKKDSSGLKLWKRRWFVLSNYCLFYYKDSREESVLGSIPLPSYKILFCTPRECKNRKFTFKVVHQGMRSYFFSADTQEDMLGWVRALSQSAAMEPSSSMNRRCSSYQDFTQIGGSSESVEFPRSTCDGEDPAHQPRQVTRTLSEPSHLTGGRKASPHLEHRGRPGVRQRNSSPSPRPPSTPDFSSRRARGPNPDGDSPPYTADSMSPRQTEIRGQLWSRPHTPVGRVDIRPQNDLHSAPASPKLEFKSPPNTLITERWQNPSKPTPTYGSVHYIPSGRRPVGKSFSTGAHADLLPPLPPSSRAVHAPHPSHLHHHHHLRSHLSVCLLPQAMPSKSDLKEIPPIRPLESDADAVLTRLCGCDKLLQSLSVELAQLQMDKDSVQCALEVSRVQLEEWKSQGPRAQEETLSQKALLQEELVTIRARMCDVSLEMERVWSQYERMESELSVIHSHLQHICNFGMPQEQSQAQRELWMMEDILAGLKVNRDHFRLLLGLQRLHMSAAVMTTHPGATDSPTERLQTGFQKDEKQEPPARPPLPQEIREYNQDQDVDHGWMDSPYEGIYSRFVDPVQRRGKIHPDLLKAPYDARELPPSSKWSMHDTPSQSTKMKMSEEEQIERMKRNQERLSNRKKPPVPTPGAQIQQSHTREAPEEAPFPLRVTRVVTAVLPSSLVARRVSVEDPPAEIDTPLLEQIPPKFQLKPADQRRKMLNKPPRQLLSDGADQKLPSAETQPIKKASRQQHHRVRRSDASRVEQIRTRDRPGATGHGNITSDVRKQAVDGSSALLTPDVAPDLQVTPEQREAKLRRVDRIRERVTRSAIRESGQALHQLPVMKEGLEDYHWPPTLINDKTRKQRTTSDSKTQDGCRTCGDTTRNQRFYEPVELQLSLDEDEGDCCHLGNETQDKDPSGKPEIAKTRTKLPASQNHISSLTVFQKDGGKGFWNYRDRDEEVLEEPPGEDRNFSSNDMRTKWFLSTSRCQGLIPLQIHDTDLMDNEDTSDFTDQPICTDEMMDSGEMSSTVSQSLEKMKENYSLFYKIACDISISDTDITRNDGNLNAQPTSGPEEEAELVIRESIPAEPTYHPERMSEQEIGQSDMDENRVVINTQDEEETIAAKAVPSISGEDAEDEEFGDNLKHEIQANQGASESDSCAQKSEDHTQTQEEEDTKVDEETSAELKKPRSLCEDREESVQEQGSNFITTSSVYAGGRVIRGTSLGKTRVTVLRTSL
ncbi:pleckstrin homology domain-containing family A member 7 isoform X2 [Thalassophryne amazonica]|uniref:pleckstrin homology domain-containing family A member 7 isoform X2 n=1 Tax=Thalassophryne amazonica TaxID=390379 RepID=UPI0014716E04|nr:pleckstrin homology domain-containing family A member 7 isoform X2 [Thalassophryne amazonica]